MRVFSSRWWRSTTPFGHSLTIIPGSFSGSHTQALPCSKQILRLSSASATAGPTCCSVVLTVSRSWSLLLPVRGHRSILYRWHTVPSPRWVPLECPVRAWLIRSSELSPGAVGGFVLPSPREAPVAAIAARPASSPTSAGRCGGRVPMVTRRVLTLLRGVRCGVRQLRITALLPKGFHEYRRLAMTNSVCNSGRDSTRPPGPATDRYRTEDPRRRRPSAGADEVLPHDAASFLLVIIAAATLLFAPPAGAARQPRGVPVTDVMLQDPDPDDWLM